MKLLTTIKPRTHGTVTVRDASGKPHVFTPDDAGVLVCEIEDHALIGRLLATEDFEPADAADHQAAEELLRAAVGQPGEFGEGEGEGEGDDLEDDAAGGDGDPEKVPLGTLPVEANTPPVASARPRKGQRAAT